MKNTSSNSELLGPLMFDSYDPKSDYLANILCSPSDVGVMRNRGRNGSRYAPEAIINRLKKLNNHFNQDQKIYLKNVTSFDQELKNLEHSREEAIKKIGELTHPKKTIHLGGGHDQIFPLLMALDKSSEFSKILIINIDAHCDTRVSNAPNSGTPFRDYDLCGSKTYHLIQYGIQDYSNSKTTLTKLARCTEEKHFIEEVARNSSNFSKIDRQLFKNIPFEVDKDTAVIFSLDCDGIDGSNMKAVSAINPNGLPARFVAMLSEHFNDSFPDSKKFYGFYEFNPVYEDTSLYSTKVVCSLIYDILKFK